MKHPDPPTSDHIAWHRAENLLYDADHGIWLDFTSGGRSAVLDLGCGIGRVAHPLARAGRSVLGIDNDQEFVDEFAAMGSGLTAQALVGDVLELASTKGPLGRETFDRIIAPQNLIQIIGGPDERGRLFEGIRYRLAEGGQAAITFIEELPNVTLETLPPEPEHFEHDDWKWISLATRLDADPGSVTLHRRRTRLDPTGHLTESDGQITFTRLDAWQIEREMTEAGLGPIEFRDMPTSPDYVDSVLAVGPAPEES